VSKKKSNTGQRLHSAVSTVPAGGGDEAAGDGGLGMQGGGGRAAADGNGEWSPGVSSTPSHRSTTHLSTTVVDLLSPLIAVRGQDWWVPWYII
jgi:hypothetical protein